MIKSATQPLCRYCGAAIKKHTVTVYIKAEQGEHDRSYEGFNRYAYTTEKITSKDQCKKLTNYTVASVRWHRDKGTHYDNYTRHPENDHIDLFTEWDGESYVDQFFCNGDHAKQFAYVMARAGHQSQASADAHKARMEKKTA